MRNIKIERECDAQSLLWLNVNNHTSVFVATKSDREMVERLLCRYGYTTNLKRKKSYVVTFEKRLDTIYTVYTLMS